MFKKYFVTLFAAAVVPLLVNTIVEAWLGYRDRRATIDDLLRVEAQSGAVRIQSFMDSIVAQLGWTVHLPWTGNNDESQRIDAFRLLRQVPAIMSLTLIDGQGRERLHVSRLGVNRFGAGIDLQHDPAVEGARAQRVWYGPVTYYRESEPFMTVAVSGSRPALGVAFAEVNLKLIGDVVSAIRVGDAGEAMVIDALGRLIAHPDISMVLQGAESATTRALQGLRARIEASDGNATIGWSLTGQTVMATVSPVPGPDWTVIAAQPISEAFAPIYAALLRSGALIAAAMAIAAALAYRLVHRMVGPIRLLGDGVERIGAGDFDHRIAIRTGDEFEHLADRVNGMARDLTVSLERQERIAKLRRFLAPQVAELVDRTGDDSLLEGRRVETVALFCDLRGFTAFSASAEVEEVMRVLGEYYSAVGAIVVRHGATLTHLAGDGLMVLVNAPVPVAAPAATAIQMALQIQEEVQVLVTTWRQRGHALGLGIGMSFGLAMVGRVGFEGRLDYTAIGSVINLASRLCSLATDRQILIDQALAASAESDVRMTALGPQPIKGFELPVNVFAVSGPC